MAQTPAGTAMTGAGAWPGTTTARAGAGIAAAVAGAGLLLVPALVAGAVTPGAAIAGWVLHGAAGAGLCAAIGVSVRRSPATSLDGLVGAALGSRSGRLVRLVYLVGFTVGQAALAYVAGGLATAGGDGPGRGGVVVAGLAVLAVAAVAAVTGRSWTRSWPPLARHLRLAATVLVAAYLCLHPALPVAAGLWSGVPAGSAAVALFLMLFAFVGWERIIRVAPGLPSSRSVVAAAVSGAALATAAYLVLTLLLAGSAAGGLPSVSTPDRVVAVVGAAVLASYCVTNLAAAGGFLRASGRWPARWPARAAAPVVAVVAGAVLSLAVAAQWRTGTLLLVPAAAAWLSYSLAMVAVLRRGRGVPNAASPASRGLAAT
jgi:amino acid efflux transporter